MARGGLRLRPLSAIFGVYFVAVFAVAYFLSAPVAANVDPGATFWICTAYLLLGALGLVGVCLGALRRSNRLGARLEELEEAQRMAIGAATPAVEMSESSPETRVPVILPSDRDVDQLLLELHRLGESAAADASPVDGPGESSERMLEDAAGLSAARGREIRRIQRVRDGVALAAAGPAAASIVLLGVFAALLPASDGMLVANLQLNALMEILGLGWLVGIAAYSGAAFRRLSRSAA